MKRIFLKSELPPSFEIQRVHYPWLGPIPSPDGPPRIYYEARVAPAEYTDLVSGISHTAGRMPHGFDYRKGGALAHFHPTLPLRVIEDFEKINWSPLALESWTTKTADGRAYSRISYVAVDDRSSEVIRLYISTTVPYENEEGYAGY